MSIVEFNPKGKTFIFSLTEDTCHKLNEGECSLFKKMSQDSEFESRQRNSISYCNQLYNKMLNKELSNDIISITKFNCGHYVINNGQHRTCIASKKI